MSYQYNRYLEQHKTNVKKGFDWIKENIPVLIRSGYDYEWEMGFGHDASKTDIEEYNAYDAYFYGGNKSFSVVQNFKKAWLNHIHKNPHHWQHWILINDDPEEAETILEMPYNYILEMICDWWAFSWASGNLDEIFKWYDERKDYIKLNPASRNFVELILSQIKATMEALK